MTDEKFAKLLDDGIDNFLWKLSPLHQVIFDIEKIRAEIDSILPSANNFSYSLSITRLILCRIVLLRLPMHINTV